MIRVESAKPRPIDQKSLCTHRKCSNMARWWVLLYNEETGLDELWAKCDKHR